MTHGLMLSLHFDEQSLLTLGSHLGSGSVSAEPFKHGGQDDMDGTQPVTQCGVYLWAEPEHGVLMILFQTCLSFEPVVQQIPL